MEELCFLKATGSAGAVFPSLHDVSRIPEAFPNLKHNNSFICNHLTLAFALHLRKLTCAKRENCNAEFLHELANDVDGRFQRRLEWRQRCHPDPGRLRLEQSPAGIRNTITVLIREHRRKPSMWKVERIGQEDRVVLLVSGRIERKHLPELREVLTGEAEDRDFVLDLREVKLVDQDAIAFLSHYEAGGAELRNCPPYIREWIERDRESVITSDGS
jgi:hypothetical protein